jgi:hypothetical protein
MLLIFGVYADGFGIDTVIFTLALWGRFPHRFFSKARWNEKYR